MVFTHCCTGELIKTESCSSGICTCDDDAWADIHQTLGARLVGAKKDGVKEERCKDNKVSLVRGGHEGG